MSTRLTNILTAVSSLAGVTSPAGVGSSGVVMSTDSVSASPTGTVAGMHLLAPTVILASR